MKPVGAPLALVTFVFALARKVCIVGVIKIENLMERRVSKMLGDM